MITLYHSKHNWRIICLAMVFITNMSATALGLGDIKVNSALNEPLAAQIIVSRGGSEANMATENITVGLASAAVHNSSGIIFSELVQDLRFSIIEDNTGQIILRVHTRLAVYEPLLSFMVNISSAAGNLTKEYSVILDPAPLQPVQKTSHLPANAAKPAPATATRSTQKPYRAVRKPNKIVIHGDNYTVKNGDSLSRIAVAASKNNGMNVKEYMRLIYANNPEAFQGTMDLLLANATLAIPTAKNIETKPSAALLAEGSQTTPVTTSPKATPKESDTKSRPRLQLVPPETQTTRATPEKPDDVPGGKHSSETPANNDSLKEMNELKEQLALIQGKNQALEDSLQLANDNLAQLRVDIKNIAKLQQKGQTGIAATKTQLDWGKWLPLLLSVLAGMLAVFLVVRKKNVVTNQSPNTPARQVANRDEETYTDFVPETIDVPTFTEIDGKTFENIINVPDIKDDLVASQEISQPTIQTSSPDAISQTYMGSLGEHDEDASQNLNAAQEAEIYLAYQQFKLAKKTIDKLTNSEPDNYKYKILRLQLLAKTAKMDELQELSVELFKQFPDRSDEVHQRIQEICDMAFTANQQTSKAVEGSEDQLPPSGDITAEMDLVDTLEMPDQTLPGQDIDDTLLLNDDITEFLSEDLTLSNTGSDKKTRLDESDLPLNHTDLLEPDVSIKEISGDNNEYDEISTEVTELMDDITESELELPFDLESEINQEEEKTRLSENPDHKKDINP